MTDMVEKVWKEISNTVTETTEFKLDSIHIFPLRLCRKIAFLCSFQNY